MNEFLHEIYMWWVMFIHMVQNWFA